MPSCWEPHGEFWSTDTNPQNCRPSTSAVLEPRKTMQKPPDWQTSNFQTRITVVYPARSGLAAVSNVGWLGWTFGKSLGQLKRAKVLCWYDWFWWAAPLESTFNIKLDISNHLQSESPIISNHLHISTDFPHKKSQHRNKNGCFPGLPMPGPPLSERGVLRSARSADMQRDWFQFKDGF